MPKAYAAETIVHLNQEFFGNCARGEGWIVVISIACVFKKLSEASAEWYDAGEWVACRRLRSKKFGKNEIAGERRKKWGQSKISS